MTAVTTGGQELPGIPQGGSSTEDHGLPDSQPGRPWLYRLRPKRLIDWMVLPTVIILAFVIAYPAVRAVQLSLTSTNLINPISHGIGLKNYHTLLHDSTFFGALKNTFVFSAASVAVAGLAGLLLALIAERFLGRVRIVQTLLLTPWAVPTVVAAYLFRYMLQTVGGLVDSSLVHLHVVSHPVPFLTSPSWSLASVTGANIWTQIPFFFLIFLAALRAVPGDVLEAARVDGARYWSTTWHIKLNYLRGPATIAVLIMIIANFNNFALPESMTGGGPGFSTTTLVVYVYQLAFSSYNVGYAAAVGVIWLIVLLLFALLFIRAVRSNSGGSL